MGRPTVVSRASSSGGRLSLHVRLLGQEHEDRCRIMPLRSNRIPSDFNLEAELQGIASEIPAGTMEG
jgi:hypothetical protein